MKAFLHELEIKSFRGSSQSVTLSFEGNKRIALIFGNNGTGKSTICDAMDFIGNSRKGSLEDKKFGGPGIDKTKYVHSVGQNATDVFVRLKCEEGEWTATLGGKSVSIAPGPHALDVRVLRRSNIQSIVQANPKDRYAIMQEFLDLASVEHAEGNLRQAAKNMNTRLTRTAERLANARNELDRHWRTAGSSNGTSIEWARALASAKVNPPQVDDSVATLRNIQTTLTRLDAAILDWNVKKKSLESAEETLKDAQQKLESAIKHLTSQDHADVLQTLEEAEKYFVRHASEGNCPVCVTPFAPGELLRRVKTRIQGMKEIQAAQKAQSDAQRRSDTSKSLSDSAEVSKNEVIEELRKYRDELKKDSDQSMTRIRDELSKMLDDSIGTAAPPALADQINGQLMALQQAPQHYETIRRTKAAVEPLVKEIETIEQSQSSLDSANARIAEAVKVLESCRKGYVDEVLDEISDEANRLYAILHPNEELGGIRLSVREKGQGSVGMSGEFHGQKDVPPEAFFSDSHLDTLGICIFLALAKRKGNKSTVLVLDDLISSVDNEHTHRLVDLLADEASSFGHTVITTHLELLEEWFRHHKKANGQTQFMQIAEWSLTNGFRIVARQFQTDLLKTMIGSTPLDKRSVGMKAGVLLETLLKQIALSFSVPMPLRNPPRYDLSEYLKALNSEWRHKNIAANGSSLATFLDPIENSYWVRNVLAHGNTELAMQLPDADVKVFAELVLKMNDEFNEQISSKKRQPC